MKASRPDPLQSLIQEATKPAVVADAAKTKPAGDVAATTTAAAGELEFLVDSTVPVIVDAHIPMAREELEAYPDLLQKENKPYIPGVGEVEEKIAPRSRLKTEKKIIEREPRRAVAKEIKEAIR